MLSKKCQQIDVYAENADGAGGGRLISRKNNAARGI